MPSGPAVKFYRTIVWYALKLPSRETGKPRGYTIQKLRTLAEKVGKSLDRINQYVRELKACGWIEAQLQAGVRVFLRPLVFPVPDRSSHEPRPPKAFTEPLRRPDGTRLDQAPRPASRAAAVTAAVTASATLPETSPKTNPGSGESTSKITEVPAELGAAVLPYTASFGGIVSEVVEREEKQQAGRRAAGAAPTAAGGFRPYANPEQGRVAADLLACGVWERAISDLIARIPLSTLSDAISIVRWRKRRGEDVGDENGDIGGYVNWFANRLHSDARVTRPRRWLTETGRIPAAPADAGPSAAGAKRCEPLPPGSHASDRHQAGETRRAMRTIYIPGKQSTTRSAAEDELIVRLAKYAVGWKEGTDCRSERVWRDRANEILRSREYLYFPLRWQPPALDTTRADDLR